MITTQRVNELANASGQDYGHLAELIRELAREVITLRDRATSLHIALVDATGNPNTCADCGESPFTAAPSDCPDLPFHGGVRA
jgi:hypothetical protein